MSKEDDFSARIKAHIDSIGIGKINEEFRKITCGPTNEEFFGKETADYIKQRIKNDVQDERREIVLEESEFDKIAEAHKPENIEKTVKEVRNFRKNYKK